MADAVNERDGHPQSITKKYPPPLYRQAHVTYAQVEASGPASTAIGFPAPVVHRAEKCKVWCGNMNPASKTTQQGCGYSFEPVTVLMPVVSATKDDTTAAPPSPYAYRLTGTQLNYSLCGEIVLADVLELCHSENQEHGNTTINEETTISKGTVDPPLPFYRKTHTQVVIKMDRRKRIVNLHDHGPRGIPHPENPWKEISALQLLLHGNLAEDTEQQHVLDTAPTHHHPNVIDLLTALADDECLYEVLPYYSGGSLQDLLRRHSDGLDEDRARRYFRQLLSAIDYLAHRGVCHRDISTSNILLNHEQDECVLMDFGMALRVPYSFPDDHQTEDVTDVSIMMGNDDGNGGDKNMVMGTVRRRKIHSQSHCGKLRFMAPEMYQMQDFDGLTIDLWSAAAVLFWMLTGRAPYDKPDPASDAGYHDLLNEHYYWDPRGVNQVFSWGHAVSEEAVDLLKNMFRPDPKDRLTLGQVMAHPWVHGEKLPCHEKNK